MRAALKPHSVAVTVLAQEIRELKTACGWDGVPEGAADLKDAALRHYRGQHRSIIRKWSKPSCY
jgi:2-iminoacetate synthase ThiH